MKVSRNLWAVTSLALALTLTAACGGGSGSGDAGASGDSGSVTYAGFGGTGQEAIAKAWLDPFGKESGVGVVQDNPVTYAKIHQMVDAKNVTWDIAQGGADFGLEGNPRLEDIDCSVVSCGDYADGPFKVYKQGVPLFVFSIVLAYNTDKFGSNPPRNYAAFFDTAKYPGKRAIDGTAGFQGILEAALMANGTPRDQLYPLDVDAALKLLEPIKDDLIVFKDAAECINLVSSGEAVMGNCYNGRVKLAKDEGQPIDNTWGQQIYLCDYLFVPKGAKDKANAMKLIAYIAKAANNGKITEFIPYGPANPKATASGKYAADAPTAHQLEGEDAPIVMDSAWWNANMEKAIEKTTAWLAG